MISICWINFILEPSVWNPSLTPACLSGCLKLSVLCLANEVLCGSVLCLFLKLLLSVATVFFRLFAVLASLVCFPPLLPFHSCSPLGFCRELPIWWVSCWLYLIAGALALAALNAGAASVGSALPGGRPGAPATQLQRLIQLRDWLVSARLEERSFFGLFFHFHMCMPKGSPSVVI